MIHRLVEAGPLWRCVLNTFGLAGIVMPWPTPTIYYLSPWHKSPEFIRHELVHVAQIRRMGRVTFSLAYLYYLARYGYRANPLEIEAYGHEESRR
jgi:hypothetical protein